MKYEEFDYDAYFNDACVDHEARKDLQEKIQKQFRIVETLTTRFNKALKEDSHVELIFVRGSNISPQSSSNFGHVIRLPAQLVTEYYKFLDDCLGARSHDLKIKDAGMCQLH